MRVQNKSWRIQAATIATITMGLSGCATISQEECQVGDWYQVGYEDGQRGYRLDRLASHRKECSKYAISVDDTATQKYRQGRDKGLRQYCTPHNGFEVGRDGDTYYNVCPADLEKEFSYAYRLGRQYYELEREIKDIDNDISRRRSELNREGITEEQKRVLWREIDNLERDKQRIRRAMDILPIRY